MSTSRQLDFVTVDVFTAKPFEGNPLAIIRIPKGVSVSQEQKQAVAREFNLSESTFLHEHDDNVQDDNTWTVDIFMTDRELPFAGHPTIGTACYVLSRAAQQRKIDDGVIEARFNLKAGPVGLRYDVAKRTAKAAIPHNVHIHAKRWTQDELFNVQPRLEESSKQGRLSMAEDFPVVSIVKGMTFVLIELGSLEALGKVAVAAKTLTLDYLDKDWDQTFIGTYYYVRTAQDTGGLTSIRTRMIEGPLEDPATGSAASDLAAYLSLKEGRPGETLKYEIVQGVEMGRRSEIFVDVELAQDLSIVDVYLGGGAVQVMAGRVTI